MLNNSVDSFRHQKTLRQIWLAFYQDKVALYSFYIFTALIFIAIFAPYITPYNVNQQFVGQALLPPSWFESGKISHFLGTDNIGRDVLSRLLVGTSYTFGTALVVALATAILGGLFGTLAGLSHGVRSRILGHFFDSFISIPTLLTAIIIATLMKASLANSMLAITLALLPYFIHEISQVVRQELNTNYITMLRLDGATHWQQLKACFVPKVLIRYMREVSKVFVVAIVDIAALSFISLGAQAPTPEWGLMIKDSVSLIFVAPWLVILPGIALLFTVMIWLIFSNGLCHTVEKYYE
ncbi:peptide ABC transporter permease [Actinobacillus delphinicola]|uniref:ABC transporter permease subunit n=1 Tax=Actinobacillus delphinicola TaxID=51161 RepID=UPI002440F89C|nr:ABC transporter permease subunit [Actinobacillus delphinicola]MDG6897382.1 peptide ABC transporter permease [Actinobacillus delphinicola]